MSRIRALISGIMAAVGWQKRNLPGPPQTPAKPGEAPEPKPMRRRGNNRKHRQGSGARRAKGRMERASRARNLGQKGQRKKRSR